MHADARRPLIVLAMMGVPLWLAERVSPATARELAITGVNLLDGHGGPVRPGVTVLIEGDRIAAVEDAGRPVPPAAARIDGAGKYLLPGFIDMHAHLLVPVGGAPPRFDRAISERMLGALLDFGITFVRCPATPTVEGLALRDDLNDGRVRGPRALASMELINDPELAPGELRRIVREALPRRPDHVKAYGRLTPASVAALIDEGHAHGLPVIGHLGRTSWLEGAQMGIDHLVHAADWSVRSLPVRQRDAYQRAVRERGPLRARIDWLERVEPDGPEVRATVEAIARRGIDVDLTLVAYDTKFTDPALDRRYRANPHAGVVPELLAEWRRSGQRMVQDWTGEDFRRWRAAWPKLQALVRRYHRGGVLLVTGTDLTNPWVIPGESLHQEFELLVEAGLAPATVLAMTGANAARALRRSDIGVIEPGRRADLVLLAANPLEDIRNTRRIVQVLLGGRTVWPCPASPAVRHR